MPKFYKGQKFLYKPKPWQKTPEFLARLRKQGFKKGHKIHLGKKLKPGQGFQKENKHWNWMGDNVGLGGLHIWINKELGKPMKCEHCGTETAKLYDWANKYHTYKRDKKDWLRLCRGCHMKYDIENGYRTYKSYGRL